MSEAKTNVEPAEASAAFTPATILGSVQMHYQPISDLENHAVVGYEALARFPRHYDVSRESVFRAARRLGIENELELECREAAYTGAHAAGMCHPDLLFVNIEPSLLHVQPRRLPDFVRSSPQWNALPIVLELTERGLSTDPVLVMEVIEWARGHGVRIAFDDVGVNPESVALLPILCPDVVKLDAALISDDRLAQTVGKVVVDAARRIGATVVAEGIERPDQLDRARALGADLGQGYLLGRPAPLSAVPGRVGKVASGLRTIRPQPGRTPWDIVNNLSAVEGSHDEVAVVARRIRSDAMALSDKGVVLASYPSSDRYSPAIAREYRALAEMHSVVAAIGMEGCDLDGVRRGGVLHGTSDSADQFALVVIAGDHAIALVVTDSSDTQPSNRCRWVITRDWNVVTDVAASLFVRVGASKKASDAS